MSLRGKVIGAIVGFTTGGPLGAAIGAFVGEKISQNSSLTFAVCPYCLKKLQIPKDSCDKSLFICPNCTGTFILILCSSCSLPYTGKRDEKYLICPRCDYIAPGIPVIDAFQTLRLPPNSDYKTVKKQYLKLTRQYHPDKIQIQNDCIYRINCAYKIASEYIKRRNSS